MHIRFDSSLAGQNFAYQPGDVVNWPDEDEARRLVDAGLAVELTPQKAQEVALASGQPVRTHRLPRVETATRQAQERAVRR